MSKPLLLFIIMFLAVTSNAQLSKGKVFIGGIAGYGHQNTKQVFENKNSSFYFSPAMIGRAHV